MPKCFVDFDEFFVVVDDTEFDALVVPLVFSVEEVVGFWVEDEEIVELDVVGIDVVDDV
jgi:hypothetical protein